MAYQRGRMQKEHLILIQVVSVQVFCVLLGPYLILSKRLACCLHFHVCPNKKKCNGMQNAFQTVIL